MPIGDYYGGDGAKVMRAMKKTYGDKKAEQVFYAKANTTPKAKPGKSLPKKGGPRKTVSS